MEYKFWGGDFIESTKITLNSFGVILLVFRKFFMVGSHMEQPCEWHERYYHSKYGNSRKKLGFFWWCFHFPTPALPPSYYTSTFPLIRAKMSHNIWNNYFRFPHRDLVIQFLNSIFIRSLDRKSPALTRKIRSQNMKKTGFQSCCQRSLCTASE